MVLEHVERLNRASAEREQLQKAIAEQAEVMEKTKAMLAEAMRENESLKQSLQQQIEQTLLSQKLLAVSKQREISSDPKSPPNTAKADS